MEGAMFGHGHLGVPQVPGVPLVGRDPNQPSKTEQFRLIALQTVSQLVMDGKIVLANDRTEAKQLADHAEVVAKFLAK